MNINRIVVQTALVVALTGIGAAASAKPPFLSPCIKACGQAYHSCLIQGGGIGVCEIQYDQCRANCPANNSVTAAKGDKPLPKREPAVPKMIGGRVGADITG